MLVEAGYLERKKLLYGVPYLYMLSHKGRMILGVNKRAETIRIERITHDVHVLDSVIYLIHKMGIALQDITSEKEMHAKDGFGHRRHYPDFLISTAEGQIAVEIETALKSKERIEKNIGSNYLEYERQIWIVGAIPKIQELVRGFRDEYSNIQIMMLKEVTEYVSMELH